MSRPRNPPTLHEKFVEQVAKSNEVSPLLVDMIINHQFKAARKALRTSTIVEISGLLYFQLRPRIACRRLTDLLSRKEMYAKLDKDTRAHQFTCEKDINTIINRIIDYDRLRPGIFTRLAKSPNTTKALEELDRRGVQLSPPAV